MWKWKLAQQLEWRWWKRYLGRKDRAEYLSWKTAYWKRLWTSLEISMPPDAKLLDAGCGPAGIHLLFPKNTSWAVDPLLSVYQKQELLFSLPHTVYLNEQLETMSLPDPMDWIFCMNVLNHTLDPLCCLNNMYQWLKPGGKFLLSVDVHRSSWGKSIFRSLPADMLHPQQFTVADYRQMIQRSGLLIEREWTEKKGVIFDYQVWLLRKG